LWHEFAHSGFGEVWVMDPWVYAAIVCMGCGAGIGLIYYVWRFTRKQPAQPQQQQQ
jgi:hypothetical protein